MKCKIKRTIYNLFDVFTCENCVYDKKDEQIMIGNNSVNVYYLFNNCQHLNINVDYVLSNSQKIKILLKEAIMYESKIMLFFIEGFNIAYFYDVFSSILDDGLSVQVITF